MASTAEDYESTDQADFAQRASPLSGADQFAKLESATPLTQSLHITSSAGNGENFNSFGDLTGQVVGHYQVERRLGGGAMASVYLAQDQILDKTVALKVLLPGADGVTRERFRREARTVATLEHDHVVRTYQVGQTSANGIIYIAMELVVGSSLAELLERQSKLDARDSCRILEPIARALAYAHQHGVVHRDVKPSNILLRWETEDTASSVYVSALGHQVVPLLSDFGIARALDSPELTNVGRTIGTPAFMSPEQCAGDANIDGRADIYSLGAVLYRCVVGRTPFVGTTTQILHAHVYDPLLIPENVAAQLPVLVIDVLRRSLMKEPGQRYASAALMAADLGVGVGYELDTAPMGGDQTRTMTTLPTSMAQGAPTPSHELVPPRLTKVSAVLGGHEPTSRSVDPRTTSSVATQAEPRGSGSRTGILILIGALLVLVAILGVTLLNSMLPELPGYSEPTPPRGLSKQNVTSTVAGGASVTTMPDNGQASTSAPGRTTGDEVVSVVESATPTATVTQPLEVSLEYAWGNAEAFYQDGDLEDALTWLIAVRRIDPEFNTELIDEMLIESYVGMAATAVTSDRMDDASQFLDSALVLAPDTQTFALLRQAAATLAAAADDQGSANASEVLQQAFAAHAADLAAADKYCAAQRQVATAIEILADVKLLDAQDSYKSKCDTARAEAVLHSLSGSLIYSVQQDGVYRIFRVPIGLEIAPVFLIDNGAQPGMRPDGEVIAFHSLRPDMQGLAGFDLNAALNPNDRTVRYTDFVEDARDGPPSWNPQGDRLAYASTNFGDGRSRVYLTWADGSRRTTTLGLGKDPAWHPSRDLLVYSGADETGNQPGLWLTNLDGSERQRLTDNGNDQRPTWSPDGQHVVFMSNGRDGNWELYRVDIVDQTVVRLTNHIAQDGLPAVSPDGRHVAFMSDRDGYWRIWYVAMDGGEPQPLSALGGELPKWLEHAVQWVR